MIKDILNGLFCIWIIFFIPVMLFGFEIPKAGLIGLFVIIFVGWMIGGFLRVSGFLDLWNK